MRNYLLFTSLLFFSSVQALAQNSDSIAIKKYYEANAILWLGKTKYFKNNQSFPLKQLKTEIKFSPDATYEFDQYRRNLKILMASIIATEVLAISSILAIDPYVKLGLLGGSLITLSIALPANSKTWAHLNRSIWLHNRDILLR
ncbi:MAG: hypothetical protein JJE09_09625 [Bacteroidia bacterium]|nr:hypothetical protein [Bacteroidia bacterium]